MKKSIKVAALIMSVVMIFALMAGCSNTAGEEKKSDGAKLKVALILPGKKETHS